MRRWRRFWEVGWIDGGLRRYTIALTLNVQYEYLLGPTDGDVFKGLASVSFNALVTVMAELLEIAQLGNPVLREIAQPVVDPQDPELQEFLDQLLATMVEGSGVGIAAPQVGRSLQALVVASRPNLRYPHAPLMAPVMMLNPQLLSHDEQVVVDWEGCLSIPGLRGQVPRYQAVEISYITRDGKTVRQELTDFVARIFQHEFDHLRGKVYLDRVQQIQDLVTEQEYLKRVL